MDVNLTRKAIQHVQVNGALIKRAMNELAPYREDAEKAAEAQATLVQAMLAADMINPEQVKLAQSLLGSHHGTMKLLAEASAVLQKQTQKSASDLGSGVSDEDSGFSSQSSRPAQVPMALSLELGTKTAADYECDRILHGG